MMVHPDRNVNDPDASKNMAMVNNAWEVLRDPQSREEFDLARTLFLAGDSTQQASAYNLDEQWEEEWQARERYRTFKERVVMDDVRGYFREIHLRVQDHSGQLTQQFAQVISHYDYEIAKRRYIGQLEHALYYTIPTPANQWSTGGPPFQYYEILNAAYAESDADLELRYRSAREAALRLEGYNINVVDQVWQVLGDPLRRIEYDLECLIYTGGSVDRSPLMYRMQEIQDDIIAFNLEHHWEINKSNILSELEGMVQQRGGGWSFSQCLGCLGTVMSLALLLAIIDSCIGAP